MKILNASQIREADAYTIKNEPVKSIDLMERASAECTAHILPLFDKSFKFFIFCGTGNNGGDGLAISRQLFEKGYDVAVYILDFSSKESDDFVSNKKSLKKYGIKTCNLSEKRFPTLTGKSVIIDCIFGTGLSKPVEGEYAMVIHHINKAAIRGIPVIAIDFPSGLFAEDNSSNTLKNIVKANVTLTFQVPKLAFLFAENAIYTGKWKVVNIGLDSSYIERISSPFCFVDYNTAASLFKKREKFAHKGTYGHALIIAGSYGKMGAAVLAAKACLRSGPGLLTTQIPKTGFQILQTTVPESMLSIDNNEQNISESIDIKKYSSIGAGPGIGKENETVTVIKMLIQNATSPLILDADALNILSENKTWLSFLPLNTILTPHPKEFERLAGKSKNSFERLTLLREFAQKYQVTVILKGAHTAIAFSDGSVYFNSTGNPGMATGGSGDVLTGVLTGLLAQGYNVFQAGLFGVYLHGLAGDLAREDFGEDALIASDIINNLPGAFLLMSDKKQRSDFTN
ncbi:MAG: NAD(P)H-hydrate dehydratase [Bacteroidota bacterium]|nr:NAD(P)H-hydrate dehydratase [Bacteroidota bacterium]